VAGEKMSKSLGNSLLVDAMVTRVRPVELRYYLGQAHYRSPMEYSPEALAEAVAAYRRIEGFVVRASELTGVPAASRDPGASHDPAVAPGLIARSTQPGAGTPPGPLAAFAAALDDDLSVPQALAAVHEAIHEGNNALAAGDTGVVGTSLTSVRAMLGVLGLDPLAQPWAGRSADDDLREVVDALVTSALAERQAARARGDYAAADAIRYRLQAAGVLIEDTPDGPRWELKR
jgi:cysteinyl-tRNA synthetase